MAQDPVAAVRAFHAHVHSFFEQCLGCSCSPDDLHLDGIASKAGATLVGDVFAAFGAIEPQMRGSLHIHLLLHLLAFQTPQDLFRRFHQNWKKLEECLWSWTQSILFTSVEALPTFLQEPAVSARLQELQPLPYTDENKRQLGEGASEHLATAASHWASASPACIPVACTDGTWFDPRPDAAKEQPKFRTWTPEYAASDVPSAEWGQLLLFDFRHSAVACCLHECRPGTCHKGFLGKLGFCRLGYWRWENLTPDDDTHLWRRAHGMALQPTPLLGTLPPHEGVFFTERHHHYFARVNPAILLTRRCNHDVNVLLRLPPVPDSGDAQDFLMAQCVQAMRAATFYITSYTGKVQPHLMNIWNLLSKGHSNLQDDLAKRQVGDQEHDSKYVAQRTLFRMITSCKKKNHKSMQEMVNYLLGLPEFYCTHEFRPLYYANLCTEADSLLQQSILVGERACASSISAIMFARPSVAEDEDDEAVDTSGISKSVTVDKQRQNYEKRGAGLQSWPFYFYVASVSIIQGKKVVAGTPTVFRFLASHRDAADKVQQLLSSRPWYVPELIGPSIPAVDDDPEKRAMLLLILFKPWNPDLASLLEDFPSWSAALKAFETQLHAEAQDFLTERPEIFSQAYWATRSLRVMQHITNCSGKPAPVRGIRTNPDDALGNAAGRTVGPEDCGGPAPDDEDCQSERSDRMPDDEDLDGAVYQAEQDSQSSRAQSKFLPTL